MAGERKVMDSDVASAFFGGFRELRPIQEASLEPLLAGKNVVLSAGTGSGKTEAVVAPLLSRYRLQAIRDDHTVILYISPTKALINDLALRLRFATEKLGIRVGIRHGDRNDLALVHKPHILITTPESLNVLMVKRYPVLNDVEAVILDEVHLLYNTQRGLQLALLLGRIKKIRQTPLQWAALSATLGELSNVRDFFWGASEPAELIKFPATRSIEAQIRIGATDDETRALFSRLMDSPRRKLLVFANSRRACETFAANLQSDPVLASLVMTHYSSLSTEIRETNERQFATAPRAICIATSTLEMGIDIGDIDAVVLSGAPSGISPFLQRIGRGNRRSTKTTVICLGEDQGTPFREAMVFAAYIWAGRQGIMPANNPRRLWGAYAQQCLSIIQGNEGNFTRIADLTEELSSPPQADRLAIEAILGELEAHDLVKRHGFKNQYGATDALWEMADQYLLYGNYPLGSQTVDFRQGKQVIGTVPRYNLLRLHPGALVRIAGRTWRVTKCDFQGVEVVPAKGTGIDLGYGGAGPGGLDSCVALLLWRWLFNADQQEELFDQSSWKKLHPKLQRIQESCTETQLPYFKEGGRFRLFTFAGGLPNQLLAQKIGGGAFSDDISITCFGANVCRGLPCELSGYLNELRQVFVPSERQTVFQQKLPQSFQVDEFMQEWITDEDASVSLRRLSNAEPIEVSKEVFQCFVAGS